MAALDITGVSVRFGPVTALEQVDLRLAAGEIFALLGGSGSGKTTLLRCLGGFLTPDAGRIVLGGRDISATPAHLRPVNTMFQSYALFPHMDVAANIGFGLRRAGLSRADIDARVTELLALVRLEGFARRRIGQLSGGQQQRVALARSLAPRPDLLLLDEPLSALDRGLRDETRAELVALLRRFSITAIMVTHDQEEALATAERIGVLHQGRLVQVGTPSELYERPANRYVAGFLGAANIFPATVRASDGAGTLLDVAGGTVRAAATGHAPGDHVHLALRPERLRMGAHTGENVLHGQVAHAAYVGAALSVSLRMGALGMIRVTQTLGDGFDEMPIAGAACSVSWRPDACILLRD